VVPSTALVAAAHGRLEVARLLLDAGADPSLAASDGLTPLMCAAGQGHPEVLGLLLGRGAVVDAAHPDSGATAFHQACFSNQPDCVEALARAGCDVGLKVRFEPLTWRPIGRQVGPEVGPTSACSSCIPTGMHGPACIVWANLTPFLLKDQNGKTGREVAEAEGNTAVVAGLRVVVTEQLRAAQAARARTEKCSISPEEIAAGARAREPAPAIFDPDVMVKVDKVERLVPFLEGKLAKAAEDGDAAVVARLLGAGTNPNALIPVRAAQGRFSTFSVFHSTSVLYGAFCMGVQGA
jgi:hypothetical protein